MTAAVAKYAILLTVLVSTTGLLVGAARHADREFSAEALAALRPAPESRMRHVRAAVAAMTLEEKIGQMMMVSIPAPALSDGTAAWLASHHVGGVILLGKNVRDRAQTMTLTRDLQARGRAASAPPLLVGVDQEGGIVSRFRFLEEMRPQRELHNADAAYAAAAHRGAELRALGVNVNFSPVLDVAASPDDFIAHRAFRGDAAAVAARGSAMIRGYHDAGIIAVPKHFPGHGGTRTDSHRTLPVVTRQGAAWDAHLLPFREAIAAGARIIMTGHLLIPARDPKYPASISRVFGRMLREDMGYAGVVMTDDLAMGAVGSAYALPDAAVAAAAAGADIILAVDVSGQYDGIYAALLAAAERGDLKTADINASVMRILALKESFSIR